MSISLSKIAAQPVKVTTSATAMQLSIIELCTRPGGATSADLYAFTPTISTKGVPWRDNVAIVAKRFGYELSIHNDEARRVHYVLTPVAPAVDPEAEFGPFATLEPHWTPAAA